MTGTGTLPIGPDRPDRRSSGNDGKGADDVDCGQVYLRLSEYVDGEVDPTQAAEIATHLEACEDCRSVHAELLSLQADLGDAFPDREVPEGMWAGLEARIQAHRAEEELTPAGSFWERLLRGAPFLRVAALPTVMVVFLAFYSTTLFRSAPGLAPHPSLLRFQERVEVETLAYEQEIWQEEMEEMAVEASRELRWQMMDQMIYDYLRDLRHQAFDAEWGSLAESKG